MSCSLRQQQPTAYDDAATSTSYIRASDCELIRALAGCSEDEAGRRAWKAAIKNTLYMVGSDAGRAGGVAGPGARFVTTTGSGGDVGLARTTAGQNTPEPEPERESEPIPEPIPEPIQTYRVLDARVGCLNDITDAELTAIAQHFPDFTAVFSSGTQITHVGLDSFRYANPRVQILALGSQVLRSDLISLLHKFLRTCQLDFTTAAFQQVTDTGLRELFQVCPGLTQRLRVLYFTPNINKHASTALAEIQSCCPSAHFVQIGDTIETSALATAVAAKTTLTTLQHGLRHAANADSVDPVAVQMRNTARTEFIAAAEAFSSVLVNLFIDRPSSESDAWHCIQTQAQQLGGLAVECKRVVEAAEPERSMDALRVLKVTSVEMREQVEKYRAQIVPLRIDLKSATSRPLDSTTASPEVLQARAVLLALPMVQWTEVQVQGWVGMIGLPAEQVEIVQRALTDDEIDGEDLEGLKPRRLSKLLRKAGADDPDALAQQTLKLHTLALGETMAQSRLATAEAELVVARRALRKNDLAVRETVVELVSLASGHCPELLTHKDVKTFMDSDGLLLPGRQIADYDELRTLTLGRSKLLVAKLNGFEVVLKEFVMQGEMRGYLKEITHVQRLRHRHIIRYSCVFQHEGSMYIEMEYYKQGSLTKWIRDTSPSELQKQSVLRQVLSALACMHEEKIVHCDIKGDNVLIADDGTARICDFELSKDVGASASSIAGGTHRFMAPELHLTDGKPSAASDMYAFGVMALNALYAPEEGQPYPHLNVSVIASSQHAWVKLLMIDDPRQRPTAVKLQAEKYFDVSSTRSLPECASVALARVIELAKLQSETDVKRLVRIFRRHGQDGCTEEDIRETMRFFQKAAALHLNIDPFKNIDGKSLLHLYCEDADGKYKTLFETGTGGACTNLDARRGWERRMYGDAYDGHDADRPKYANVNFLAHTKGDHAATHYGSSYMLLNQAVRERCTITSRDSSLADARLGTLQHCAHVLLHKIERCEESSRGALVEVLFNLGKATQPEAIEAIARSSDALRDARLDYIEVQIHGDVLFEKDVDMVVVADRATQGGGRLQLSSTEQSHLWGRFTQRFGAQAFQIAGSVMVPLGQ